MTWPSEDPTLDEAPILHVDLDAFFASVEVLDDPTLVGRPVAVGGAGDRGVVASASYEARRYGVRSAMPSVVARRLCPALVMLPGRFERYEEYSRRFHALVEELTPEYEPLGLDEVFADLRGLHRLGVRPVAAAWALRARITDELSLHCGVGLGRNKLFAKIASKRSKPTVVEGRLVEGPGVVWVSPELEAQWLAEMPVGALWGVGPATAAKLRRLGLGYVRDLAKVDEATLSAHVGPALAATLAAYALGEDRREVDSDRRAKSLGHEETFARSLVGPAEVSAKAREQAAVVARVLRDHHWVARTITVVVRYDDFSGVTRAQTLPFGIDDEEAVGAIAEALVATVDLAQAVRLLGVHASGFLERDRNALQLSFGLTGDEADVRERAAQLSLERQVSREALRDAVDEVRRRFGRTAVAAGSDLTEEGVDVAGQRGKTMFGPQWRGPSPGGR
ncbi:MAG: DNA polymerase IV [Acidimicrobiales bacterium]